MKSVIQIIGTTGVGKSQLGVELAKRLNGEIINSDSMQVYQGLDIITNKHPEQKRGGIPHHLMSFLKHNEEYRIGTYEKEATSIIDELHEKEKLPVVVGGTAYYSTALVFKDMLPETTLLNPSEVRQSDPRLEKTTEELYKDLEQIDPVMATRWHPKDHRKIRRSLEIFYSTGKRQSDVYSEQRKLGRLGPEHVRYRTLFLWLWAEQSALDKRLDDRIEEMISMGLFEEIKAMHNAQEEKLKPDFTRGVYQAIGYKEFFQYLKTGSEEDKLAGTSRMKVATRQYARRQIKWIRNKLLLQCRDAGDDVQIVLLNATDLSEWDNLVQSKGLAAVNRFLACETLDPLQFCDESQHCLLRPKMEKELSSNPDAWARYVCEVCPKFVCNTKEDWLQHLSSNRHKSKLKQSRKRQDFLAWQKAQIASMDRVPSDQSERTTSTGDSLVDSLTSPN